MLNRNKSTIFYLLLVVVASITVGMVLASRLDLSTASSAQTLTLPAVNTAPITGPLTATTFRDVAKAVMPAVVNIRTESRQRTDEMNDFFGGGGGLFEDFFGTPPGGGGQRRPSEPREEVVRAAGTGFIIDRSGLILTNNHVVEGAQRIEVSLYGEDEDQEYAARIIGRDPLTDSALLELTEKPNHELPTARFGDSTLMQPGDWVMAIGNPFGQEHSVSVGVISATRGGSQGLEVARFRRADVLQTDAAINPGNSGGPLINLRGEVIGVNTAIATTGFARGNMGVGFAITSNSIREVLPQLRSGKVSRGRIGVQVGEVDRDAVDELGLKERTGALVGLVEADGPAARGGLEPGDVVIAWNGQPVTNSDDLVQMVMRTKAGSAVPVRVVRDGQQRTLTITVAELNLEEENGGPANRSTRGAEPEPTRGFGITIDNVTPELARRMRLQDNVRGAVVTAVEPGSPADRRLLPGDVLVRVGSTRITTAAEAQRELTRIPSGGTALLRVIRSGNEIFLTVTKD